MFRDLHKRTRFAGGGIVAAEISVDQSNSLNNGTFLDISGRPGDHPPFLEAHGNSGRLGRSAYTFKQRNNINSLEKKTFNKSFWGAWPPCPLATPLRWRFNIRSQWCMCIITMLCLDTLNVLLFWRRLYNDVLTSTLHRYDVASLPAL